LKRLTLVRHAKSSWSDPTLADHQRPLNHRGRHAARLMGKRLARRDSRPDLIVCSHARRALRTARILARRLDYPRRKILVTPQLYECAVQDLLKIVHGLQEKYPHVMLVGHNPQFMGLAQRLGSQITRMPTCCVVSLTFDTGRWASVGCKLLVRVESDYPKRGSE
jgi:phosphohistidine phosphatase